MIFITMVKKHNSKTDTVENELYVLPSSSEEMTIFVGKFKIDMMEHVVNSIKFAVENKMDLVEVFQFKNSKFVVTIAEKEFESNLENINKYYVDKQMYELCSRVEQLRNILKKKNDEKEKSKPNGSDSNGSNKKRK